MQANRVLCSVIMAAAVLMAAPRAAHSQSAGAPQTLLEETRSTVGRAGAQYRAGEHLEAGKTLARAMQQLEVALRNADQETFEAAKPTIELMERAHAVLQLEGIVLPPFAQPKFGAPLPSYVAPEEWESAVTSAGPTATSAARASASANPANPAAPTNSRSKPNSAGEPNPPGNPPGAGEASNPSFARQIAPILLSRCGSCHVEQRKGGFTLESYAALMKGPAEGVVVFAGDPVGSRLIEVIESGDMPRGGGKIAPEELTLLKAWVAAGARFDGPAPEAPLLAYARQQPAPPGPAPSMPASMSTPPTATAATGSETVSFARQIAPLLVGNCNGCHLDAMQTRGGLRMDTFAQLLRGGDSGPMVEPGNGDGSLLIRKLRGMEGNRMPAGGRPPLSDEDIALIRTWINEGATLDGPSPEQPLRVMMSEAWAKNATHEELAERRRELARKNWQLAAPEDARQAAVEVENEEVFVLGSVSAETAEQVAKAATAALKKVRTIIPPPPRGEGDSAASPFKGRITLFVFPRRYDYSEFSKMVERRQVPAEWDAHWQYDGVDAYASLVVDQDDPKALQGRLLAPLASLSLAARGELPRWLTEGAGRAAAARFAARDFEGPKRWDAALPAAVDVVEKPEQLIEGKLPPEQSDLIGYGLGKMLLDRGARRQFEGMLRYLDRGAPFEEAFTAAFGGPPQTFVATWLTWYVANQRR